MNTETLLGIAAAAFPVMLMMFGAFVRNETRAAKFEQRLQNQEDNQLKGDNTIDCLRDAINELRVVIQTLVTLERSRAGRHTYDNDHD
jgi:hypothetical protein